MARDTFFGRNMVGQAEWERRGAGDGRIKAAETRLDELEEDSGWVAPTLLNGWVNYDAIYGPTGYRRKNGVVYLRGLVKDGTLSTAIFTLPVGFRPVSPPIRLFATLADDLVNRIDVDGTTGSVVCAPGDATWTSLNGVTFIAEA
jgi:hypothetical protein